MSIVNKRYLESKYLEHNPSWDMEDSPWKAERIIKLLKQHHLQPQNICEIGCGAGYILSELHQWRPNITLDGYDIAPDAQRFWKGIENDQVQFTVGDFFELASKKVVYDLIMLLDVLEHVEAPQQFLLDLHGRSEYILLHFPLDLSALSVMREQPLLHVRRTVGHIHYFTKNLALELLDECGYNILDYQYTGLAFSTPRPSLKTRLAWIPRYFAYALNKDLGVRLLGGETLMILAQTK